MERSLRRTLLLVPTGSYEFARLIQHLEGFELVTQAGDDGIVEIVSRCVPLSTSAFTEPLLTPLHGIAAGPALKGDPSELVMFVEAS